MPTRRTEIAERLKQARKAAGLATLREASAATGGGLSPQRISNYEQGIREMGIPEAKVLAKAYRTTAAHILCLDDDNPVLSELEQEHLKNLRALPENERHAYIRRVANLAQAYREPLPDEEPSEQPPRRPPKRR